MENNERAPFFRRVWTGVKDVAQWAIRGAGSILSPETVDYIIKDTVDHVAGKINESPALSPIIQRIEKAYYPDWGKYIWILLGGLLLVLIMRKR